MVFNFSFYSSVLLILFVNIIIFAILLFAKYISTKHQAFAWLAIFVFLGALYFGQWMLGFAGWYNTQPYRDFMLYMPMVHTLLLGPIIYYYVQAVLNPAFTINKQNCWHLLPGILYIFYALIMLITDKFILHKYYFLADGSDRDFDTWYQYLGLISMLFYYMLSIKYFVAYKKLIVQITSNANRVMFKWLNHFLIVILIMLLLSIVFFFFGDYLIAVLKKILINTTLIIDSSYKAQWWFYFCFAILFYYLAIKGYTNHIENKVQFNLTVFPKTRAFLLPNTTQFFNANNYKAPLKSTKFLPFNSENIEDVEIEIVPNTLPNALTETEVTYWTNHIENLMLTNKLYQDPELSLPQIAKVLNTTPATISKAINQGFKQNLNDYINGLRINALKQKLINGEHKLQTIVGLAYDCGFNSKATFNRAFKKATSVSPKDWLRQII